MNEKTPDERAELVDRLRVLGSYQRLRDFAADLIEADGKLLKTDRELIAIADAAPHDSGLCLLAFGEPGRCTCWRAEYDAAKDRQS